MNQLFYAGIDAGGTEFKCVAATGPEQIIAHAKIPVTYPDATLAACRNFFIRAREEHGDFAAMGIASFGPVDLRPESSTYGYITSTPKPYWRDTDIVGYFRRELDLTIRFDTDVNGALLAEQRWGAAQGLHSAMYVTIGTGVGAGVMVDGRLLHGAMHPEAGHMLIARHPADPFPGSCPFHEGCLEGLASGPALAQRWQQNPEALSDAHSAWELQAHYLAVMCVNLSLVYSPQRIILGGGVMNRTTLLPLVQRAYLALMNSYLGDQQHSIESFIVTPTLGGMAGALGAIALAQQPA